MKNIVNLFIIVTFALTFFSCAKAEDADNFIADPEGVTIDLGWSNDEADVADGANLNLFVKKGNNVILKSDSYYNNTESVDIHLNNLEDGTYAIDVNVHSLTSITNYTLTITGKSTGKTYTNSFGPLYSSDSYTILKPWTLVVDGNHFSVSR